MLGPSAARGLSRFRRIRTFPSKPLLRSPSPSCAVVDPDDIYEVSRRRRIEDHPAFLLLYLLFRFPFLDPLAFACPLLAPVSPSPPAFASPLVDHLVTTSPPSRVLVSPRCSAHFLTCAFGEALGRRTGAQGQQAHHTSHKCTSDPGVWDKGSHEGAKSFALRAARSANLGAPAGRGPVSESGPLARRSGGPNFYEFRRPAL